MAADVFLGWPTSRTMTIPVLSLTRLCPFMSSMAETSLVLSITRMRRYDSIEINRVRSCRRHLERTDAYRHCAARHYYRLIRESCREDGAGDPCCGDCCRCPVFPSRSPVSGGERQTRPDDRGRRGNWSGDRQIREGSADDGERTVGRRRYPASEHAGRPRN